MTAAGVHGDDLPALSEVLRDPGPFVSVLVDTDRDTDDAARRMDTACNDIRRDLAARGAPTPALDAVESWLRRHRTEGDALSCVGTPSGTVVGAAGPEVRVTAHTWDTLPRLAQLVEWHQADPPALLALVDRTGADVFASAGAETTVATVEGEAGPVVRRSAPGGWSQPRYQRRAMETWRENGAEVAAAVAEHARAVGARLVVLAGDEHAVGTVVDQLPTEVARLVRRAAGGRGEGSHGDIDAEVARLHRTVVAEDSVALIERFKEELGQRDKGVAGLAATVWALRTAAVDTLLVRDDPAEDRRLFCAEDDPTALGVAEADLEGTSLVDVRAVDGLIRAAWATGAAVRVCPAFPELADGVGALLRFADPGSA